MNWPVVVGVDVVDRAAVVADEIALRPDELGFARHLPRSAFELQHDSGETLGDAHDEFLP